MNRLSSINRELDEEVSFLDEHSARQVACRVASSAATTASLPDEDRYSFTNLTRLDTTGRRETRERAMAEAEEADDTYFDLIDAPDGHPSTEREAHTLNFFKRARALTAIAAALDDDILASVADAIYEAYAASDSDPSVFEIAWQELRAQ